MRTINPTLLAFLRSRQQFFKADLFKFTLADGTVYTWTSYDQDLLVPPYTYSALGPIIDRTKWGIKNTVDIPEMEIQIYSTGADLPDGTNLKLLAHNGLFDFATVLLSRVYMPSPGNTTLGVVDLFLGSIAQITIDALGVKMTTKGANNSLAQYMPRNQYQLSCLHTLYDAGCAPNPGQPGGGPARADFTIENAVGAALPATASFIPWGSEPANSGNFNYGYVQFSSGVANGIRRTIQAADGTGITLSYPLYQVPSVGDTFTATYGCSRTLGATGCAFFNNTQHWRGFKYLPPATYGI